ncbi:unnamed protein product [Ilex paraguariensis]|uniref:Uncharacterized protein n=1 Tax=Ilex paraguariensis TaxID=185542 RepID=A0ABC8RLI7_9AQUA
MESKYKDGHQTTESEVTGMLIAALFAGQHTSSITSIWTGAYLLRHKEYMTVVLDEQKNLMRKHGNKVDYDLLSEMEVLYRSHSDFSVTTNEGKEYDISKSHIVATSPAFANRLPHVYKDPDSYDPDRFSPGREEDKAWLSWGTICIFVDKAIWSHLLRNFELELISPFPKIAWNAMVVGVKRKVMVQYKGRELFVS